MVRSKCNIQHSLNTIQINYEVHFHGLFFAHLTLVIKNMMSLIVSELCVQFQVFLSCRLDLLPVWEAFLFILSLNTPLHDCLCLHFTMVCFLNT